MFNLVQWDELINTIRRYEGGDLEWLETEGRMYRGLIKSITKSEAGDRLHIQLAWCAFQPLHAGSSWLYTRERTHLSLFRDKMTEFRQVAGSNGQISFEAKEIGGLLYPKGQNLLPSKVKDMPAVHKLRVVK